ncbi:hypothetical protein L6452_05109 [Arctium lappa]|uniref:Uncharacterized protein n=1 Tax=Arctium lappa TaxID=4217 RepID=A0ACB9EEW7_ARCLA|nr:hypothetical protein L6452_05109 [Arctium lappa]
MFSRYGVVVDMFLARKLNKNENRFCFVHFIRVQDVNKLERGEFKHKVEVLSAGSKSDVPPTKSFRISLESNDTIEVVQWLESHFVAKAKSVQALFNLPELCSLQDKQHIILESEEILVDSKVVVVCITEGEHISPPWESVHDTEGEDKFEGGFEEDDDQSIDIVEEEEDPLFVADSIVDEQSSTKNSINPQEWTKRRMKSPDRVSPEKFPAMEQK